MADDTFSLMEAQRRRREQADPNARGSRAWALSADRNKEDGAVFGANEEVPEGYDDQFLAQRRYLGHMYGYAGNENLLALSRQRRGLIGAENALPGQEREQIAGLSQEAQRATKAAVKDTRKNFSDRGLLYGGLREGGEAGARGRIATRLAESSSATRKEFAGLKDRYAEAKASLGLQQGQQNVERASMAFDNAMRNQVARMQAIQALGQGAGYAAGAAYGSSGGASSGPRGGAYSSSLVDESYNSPGFRASGGSF